MKNLNRQWTDHSLNNGSFPNLQFSLSLFKTVLSINVWLASFVLQLQNYQYQRISPIDISQAWNKKKPWIFAFSVAFLAVKSIQQLLALFGVKNVLHMVAASRAYYSSICQECLKSNITSFAVGFCSDFVMIRLSWQHWTRES